MFNKKNITLFAVILIFTLALVGCGNESGNDVSNGNDVNNENEVNDVGEVSGLAEAFAEQPTLLTSVGQSADVEMIKALMNKAGLEYEIDPLLKADDLGDEKTLILAVGGSSKGLGAAGINADDEIKRTQELVKAAKEKDMSIIAMHIGGDNRRGELSDKFIDPAIEFSDYIIVVESGNKDNYFTDFASTNNIPLEQVSSIADVIEPLEKAFK